MGLWVYSMRPRGDNVFHLPCLGQEDDLWGFHTGKCSINVWTESSERVSLRGRAVTQQAAETHTPPVQTSLTSLAGKLSGSFTVSVTHLWAEFLLQLHFEDRISIFSFFFFRSWRRNPGPVLAKQALYHWAKSPTLCFLLKIILDLFYVCLFCRHVCTGTMCVPGAWGGQKWVLVPRELPAKVIYSLMCEGRSSEGEAFSHIVS